MRIKFDKSCSSLIKYKDKQYEGIGIIYDHCMNNLFFKYPNVYSPKRTSVTRLSNKCVVVWILVLVMLNS